MNESTPDQIRALASLAGISITEQDLPEVSNRFQSLIAELNTLNELELADIQPVPVFPDESEDEV